MGFYVDGLDDAKKVLDDLMKGADAVFDGWANTIRNTAKQLCNDHEDKHIKLRFTQPLGLEYEFSDKESIDCVIRAINQHKSSMPDVLKHIYEKVILDLEAKKNEFKDSS